MVEDAVAMASQAADDVQSIIASAIETYGSAVLAIPGGETPVPIFQELASRSLDWSNVTILPTDDRLVPIEHPLSNAGLIRTYFGNTGATLVRLCEGDEDTETAGRSADEKLHSLRWPLDLVWLGMGTDGHTASILPGPDFETALNEPFEHRACGITPDPMPPEAAVARVTLTRAALVACHYLILTITGEKKRSVAELAIRDGASSIFAIGRVMNAARVPTEIFWHR